MPPAPSDPALAIEAKGLGRRYGPRVAVEALDLAVAPGEVFGFLGPNGAGKSTTIRMLCGLLRPTSGEAWVAGRSVLTEAEALKEVIGYMSQAFGLYQDLTVEENLAFYAGIFYPSRRTQRERVEETIERLRLGEYRRQLAARLSGGWKQRLALGCAIVHEPSVLFLDEPTAGIDPVSRRFLWDELYELAQGGLTLFVTTHYMEEAERCHRIGFIHQGRLVACGTPGRIKASLVDGAIVRVRASPLPAAFKALKKDPLVRDVNFYGAELHAVVADGARAAAELPGALSEAGVTGVAVEPIEASIEDVFVALSKRDPP